VTRQKTVSKILELKEFNRDQLEAEAKKARERHRSEQEKQAALEREYNGTADDFAAKQMGGTMPVQQRELFHTYLKHLGKQIDQQKGRVAASAAELAKITEALLEAHKEQRLAELLQDKIHRDLVKETGKGEQKQADYQFLARKDKT
jgi:flagellar export protein FliJ